MYVLCLLGLGVPGLSGAYFLDVNPQDSFFEAVQYWSSKELEGDSSLALHPYEYITAEEAERFVDVSTGRDADSSHVVTLAELFSEDLLRQWTMSGYIPSTMMPTEALKRGDFLEIMGRRQVAQGGPFEGFALTAVPLTFELQDVLRYTTSMLPHALGKHITQVVYDSPNGGIHGEAEQGDRSDQWSIHLHTQERQTWLHELGHVLALNKEQLWIDGQTYQWRQEPALYRQAVELGQAQCATYYVPEGCLKEGAYLLAFYRRFWVDGSHGSYVTAYAHHDPVEDFAESFAAFVLGQKEDVPTVQFFSTYPELVMLRWYLF